MTRELALEIVRTLQREGHETVWAGGCVRDLLLGRQPEDYDVATAATPEQVRAVFGKRRTLAVGEAFGVVIVLGRRDERGVPQVEVATFRSDGQYSDGRRPDAVAFCSAAEDAKRRDFTINALFLDPVAGHDVRSGVIDHVGGLADFDARVIRAVGNAGQRFEEDRLRMLRAARFAQRLGGDYGFVLETQTRTAIEANAAAIGVVSWERITQELTKMLAHPSRAAGFGLLRDMGLLRQLLPEVREDALHLLGLLGEVNAEPVEMAASLATLFRSVPIGSRRDSESDATAHGVLARMRVSNALRDRVVHLLRSVDAIRRPDLPLAEAKPLLARDDADALLAFARALDACDGQVGGSERWADYRGRTPPEQLDPPPLLVGADLIAAGLRPGPAFKDWLAATRAAQLNETIATRDEAMAMLRQLVGQATRDG